MSGQTWCQTRTSTRASDSATRRGISPDWVVLPEPPALAYQERPAESIQFSYPRPVSYQLA